MKSKAGYAVAIFLGDYVKTTFHSARDFWGWMDSLTFSPPFGSFSRPPGPAEIGRYPTHQCPASTPLRLAM